MPPTNGAYDVGSTWISSHRDPSAPSSSAASRTIRRMSASPRTQARAASYSRWNRNHPRASAVSNRGGQSVVSDDGSRMPCCAARSRTVADPHRAGEVQVEVGLGQVRDGPLGRSGRVAHSASESSSYGSSMTCTAASSAEAPAPSMPTSSPTRSFSSS